MVRRKMAQGQRNELLKEARLVTLVSANTKRRLDAAAAKHGFVSTGDLVRQAIEEKLEKLQQD